MTAYTRSEHSPLRLFSRQYDATKWACILCNFWNHNDRTCIFFTFLAGFLLIELPQCLPINPIFGTPVSLLWYELLSRPGKILDRFSLKADISIAEDLEYSQWWNEINFVPAGLFEKQNGGTQICQSHFLLSKFIILWHQNFPIAKSTVEIPWMRLDILQRGCTW